MSASSSAQVFERTSSSLTCRTSMRAPPLNLRGELHAAGRRSVSLWRRGAELLLGPWCEPYHTACWNCCRVRLSDLRPPDGERPVEPDATLVRAVAENVVLAVRHPELTPYGCVVSDQHQTTVLHSIVPLPWCAVCGGAAQMPEAELVPCGRTLLVPDELAGLADARGGVVRRVALFDTNGPSLPVCASAHVGPYENGDPSRPACTGEGKGATRDAAVRSAIGEGLERYSAGLWDPAALTAPRHATLDRRPSTPAGLCSIGRLNTSSRALVSLRLTPIYRSHGLRVAGSTPESL